MVHEPVEELPVERGRAVLPGAPAPPEPVAVHLMVRPPEDGHVGVLELLEEPGDHVDLGAPMLVERRARASAGP